MHDLDPAASVNANGHHKVARLTADEHLQCVSVFDPLNAVCEQRKTARQLVARRQRPVSRMRLEEEAAKIACRPHHANAVEALPDLASAMLHRRADAHPYRKNVVLARDQAVSGCSMIC